MLNKIVFDLETKKKFSDVGGRNKHHLLGISVAVAYSYQDDKYYTFKEDQIHKFGEMLQVADQIIGYNIKSFDYEVLMPYLNFNPNDIPTLDLLEVIEKFLGHRIRLEAIAQATLGEGKTGTGLDAVKLWNEGRIKELADYCRTDVEITRNVYEYALKNKKLRYQDFFEEREITLEIEEPEKRKNVVKQSSLF